MYVKLFVCEIFSSANNRHSWIAKKARRLFRRIRNFSPNWISSKVEKFSYHLKRRHPNNLKAQVQSLDYFIDIFATRSRKTNDVMKKKRKQIFFSIKFSIFNYCKLFNIKVILYYLIFIKYVKVIEKNDAFSFLIHRGILKTLIPWNIDPLTFTEFRRGLFNVRKKFSIKFTII